MFCAFLGHTGERLQDHWSSGLFLVPPLLTKLAIFVRYLYASLNTMWHITVVINCTKNLFIILGYVQPGRKCIQTSYRLKQN